MENIKKGRGCKECGIKKLKIKENKIEEYKNILEKNGYLWLNIDSYKENTRNSYIVQHTNCGKISKRSSVKAIVTSGCKRCMGLEKKSIEIFKEEVFLLEGNEYTVLSNDYTKTSEGNILIRHNKCGHEYYVSRTNFLRDRRCAKCSSSKGEERIIKFLDKNNIDYIYDEEIFKDLLGVKGGILRYDFYLPKYNLLIEYQGKQHEKDCGDFGDFITQQEHDKRKKEYAEKNNIQLLEIWYWDFDNIENILNKELL